MSKQVIINEIDVKHALAKRNAEMNNFIDLKIA